LIHSEAARQGALEEHRSIKLSTYGIFFIETPHQGGSEVYLDLLYADQGKMEEAEAMYRRALKGREKAWGPEHSSTLDTINNLGSLYRNQGKMKEAEAMYQRALKGYEKAWGPEHTSTLGTINNLGSLYADQGKMEEAEAMYRWAKTGKS